MRYVGLVFLGMVLWAGQASAVELTIVESEKVLIKGKVVSEYYMTNKEKPVDVDTITRITRVIWQSKLFVCQDFVNFPRGMIDKAILTVRCYDNTRFE